MTAYCDSPAALVLQTVDGAGNVTASLDLMDVANGYRISSLELAWPAVREVKADLPTRDGSFDTTALFGERTVTVIGSLITSSSGSRQAALQNLAWWVQPSLRPRLVFAVDADRPQMAIGLRGAQLGAPYTDRSVSAFTASWVAPDPAAYALTGKQIVIVPGLTTTGRTYPRTYPVTYAGTGGSGLGQANNAGTYQTWPTFTVFGPCVNPNIYYLAPATGQVVFNAQVALNVAAGDYVVIDTRAATVLYNGLAGASRYSNLDYAHTVWAPFAPGTTQLRFAPTSLSAPCQFQVNWSDAYLT